MLAESKSNTMTSDRGRGTRKWLLSIVLIFHCAAVVAPPLSLQTRGPLGSSPSVATLMQAVERYCQFLYLDRGYAFFAPDPGPSHLIQAATKQDDGSLDERMYPDRERQWPRLLYHRHFMLAEFVTEIHQPPGPPPELVQSDREQADRWVRLRARYEHVRQSIVEHLKGQSSGKSVAIRRIEHLIPDFVEFNDGGISLTDPQLYRVLLDRPLVVTPTQELPVAAPETIPPPTAEKEPGQTTRDEFSAEPEKTDSEKAESRMSGYDESAAEPSP